MHKRNIVLTALVLAALVTGLFMIPAVKHSSVAGFVYFPSILLTVILSGGVHSPSAAAGWASFLTYTLIYLVAFLVLYAFLLELYLLRSAFEHIDEVQHGLIQGQASSTDNLDRLGRAIVDLETRRRRHFLLEDMSGLDLKEPPHLLAAHALAEAKRRAPIKRLVARLQSRVTAEAGHDAAVKAIARLEQDGRALAAKAPSGT